METIRSRQFVEAVPRARLARRLRFAAVFGPGLLVTLADTDAGNVVTGAQAGEQWGYRPLPLLLLLIPMLYMVQELTVRLGIFAGRGHGELIWQNFGPAWAWVSISELAVATAGSLVSEFTGARRKAAYSPRDCHGTNGSFPGTLSRTGARPISKLRAGTPYWEEHE